MLIYSVSSVAHIHVGLFRLKIQVFGLCQRTTFLAARYLDLFLEQVALTKPRLQIVAAACLHMASKCEDLRYVHVNAPL